MQKKPIPKDKPFREPTPLPPPCGENGRAAVYDCPFCGQKTVRTGLFCEHCEKKIFEG